MKGGTGTPATKALHAAGVAFTLHAYEHDPAVTDYGREAVRLLGLDPQQVFKTLIVETGPGLAVGVVPVAGMLDLKAMARALGVKKVELTSPKIAATSSGYVVGGISPIAQKTPLPTLVDETATLFDTIFVSAGRRGLDVELAPADLLAVTGGRFADIAR